MVLWTLRGLRGPRGLDRGFRRSKDRKKFIFMFLCSNLRHDDI